MSRPPLDLRLYAVLDPDRTDGRDPLALALRAVRGGATLVQLRDKRGDTRALVGLARGLVAALEPLGVPLLVNDRVDVALAAGAAGVHLGQEDMDPSDARRLLGPDALIGTTVHHPREADEVDPDAADYAGLGPAYATASKNPKDPPLGPDGIARLLAHLRRRLPGFPACAIAGIDHRNAPDVLNAGVDGVAVISDLFMAADVAAAAGRLRRTVDRALDGRNPR
ncbi:MAG: thiamine phosphate synthase [Geminicoccaceae bacterium]|nr:thiamine phosphate synthase [Geminicoccaceae bacterium]